jgi:hypothetical protein
MKSGEVFARLGQRRSRYVFSSAKGGITGFQGK